MHVCDLNDAKIWGRILLSHDGNKTGPDQAEGPSQGSAGQPSASI